MVLPSDVPTSDVRAVCGFLARNRPRHGVAKRRAQVPPQAQLEALLDLAHPLAAHAEALGDLGQRRRVLADQATAEDLGVASRERLLERLQLAREHTAELGGLGLDVGPQRGLRADAVPARALRLVIAAGGPIERRVARRKAALHLDDLALADGEGRGELARP